MKRSEFENSKEPLTIFVSLNPENGKSIFDFLEGWDNDAYIKSISDDFPKHIHFFKLNKAAVNKRAKEMFNYDLEALQSEEKSKGCGKTDSSNFPEEFICGSDIGVDGKISLCLACSQSEVENKMNKEVCRCGHKEEEHPVLLGEDELGEIYCKEVSQSEVKG